MALNNRSIPKQIFYMVCFAAGLGGFVIYLANHGY